MSASMEGISRFLDQHRIAMLGVSHNSKDFSVLLFKELLRRGYEMIPVNPVAKEICGKPCYAQVQDVKPPVKAALLMTPAKITEQVAHDCVMAGVQMIWMYRATGMGAVHEEAIRFCRERGIEVIPGECPFMFLPETGAIHRAHGFWRKITGHYPKSGVDVQTD